MNLLDYSHNVTSEHGEDGIVEKIFAVIGDGGRWCVELGALDGKHGSNVWNLIQNKNWSSVLIEADQTYFEKMQVRFGNNPKVYGINAFVSFEGPASLDPLLGSTSIPQLFDFLSLDIDGNDYHLWESLQDYSPRVVAVEFNPSIPNDISFIQPRDMRVQQGSSLNALVELGKRKGYELIAVTETNAFFVLRDLFPKFEIEDNSIDALHTDHSFETRVFQLYDGTLVLDGNTNLIWHRMPIDPERIQVLPIAKRKYPAGTHPSSRVRSLKHAVRKLPFYALLQKIRKAIL